MSNSGLSLAAPIGGGESLTNKTSVVSTHKLVPTNWVSGRTLQPSTEPVITKVFVLSDFLVEVQVSGLGTVTPF